MKIGSSTSTTTIVAPRNRHHRPAIPRCGSLGDGHNIGMTMMQSAPASPTTLRLAPTAEAMEPTPAQRRRVWAGVLLASLAAWGVLAMGAGAVVGGI
jgi:hypothetical protein